ncbi:MAG: hypothetical protein SVR08_15220 [Spirochaetota bacterium]|nr:hypothetical protein [Spirochaetota bacterium]
MQKSAKNVPKGTQPLPNPSSGLTGLIIGCKDKEGYSKFFSNILENVKRVIIIIMYLFLQFSFYS